MTRVVFALLGANALYLTYLWLGSAIVASYLSGRKGYGERAGLASGLLLNIVGVVVWLVVPAKRDSAWKRIGPWGRGSGRAAIAAGGAAADEAGAGEGRADRSGDEPQT